VRYLQLIGPVMFLVAGFGMLFGALVVPEGSLTDDGYPLDTFLLLMGGGFTGAGLLWLGGAVLMVRSIGRKEAALKAQLARLSEQGTRIDARVSECESTGYGDFSGGVWTNITFVIELPGFAPIRLSKHVALKQHVLDRGRHQKLVALLVNPRDPNDWVFADA
jgi:hypothetical protein